MARSSGLSRELVLCSALELIDVAGLEALTMRRLGAHLGVESMALYHWVANRDDLLDSVAMTVLNPVIQRAQTIDPTDGPDTLGGRGWRVSLRDAAQSIREVALAHPAVFPLLLTRPAAPDWVRAPVRDQRWATAILHALTDDGFAPAQALHAYRGFTSFLTGHLFLNVHRAAIPSTTTGPRIPAQRQRPPASVHQDESGTATTAERAGDLRTATDAEFAGDLELLLDGLALNSSG